MPMSGHACHLPCWPQTTCGSRVSFILARALTLPPGVSMRTQSPGLIPRSLAADGCNSTSGSRACRRNLGSARCWLSQKRVCLAQGRIAMLHQGLGIQFDLACRRSETSGDAVLLLSELAVACLERYARPAGVLAQCHERNAGWMES